MFSITRNILPGSITNPDIATLIPYPGCSVNTQICKWNITEYFPIVSTLTGFSQALLGIIHTIGHLVCAIFDSKNRSQHLKEAHFGARNIGRGLVAMPPILVNNLALFIKDMWKAGKEQKVALEYKKNHPECKDQILLFIDEQKVAEKSPEELGDLAIKAGYKPENAADAVSFWDWVKLIQIKV